MKKLVINYSIIKLIILCIFAPSLFAQDNSRYDELNRRIEVLTEQLENCGRDLKCIQETTNQLQQAIKEVQALQKTDPILTGEITTDFEDRISLEGEVPPEYQRLAELWLKHVLAASKDLRLNCETIENTKDDVLDEIVNVYKKKGSLKEEWPLPIHDCNKTYVNLKERGTLDEPETYHLDYNLEFTDEGIPWS